MSTVMGLTIGIVMGNRGGAAGFTPAALFTASEKGAWYDPSDLASMFQLSTGTIAAAVNSPVGYLADKSGNGNHAIQANLGSRPILRQSGALYYLDFDGVDDRLVATLTATITGTVVTGVVAARYTTGAANFGKYLAATNGVAASDVSVANILFSFNSTGNTFPIHINAGTAIALAADTDAVIHVDLTATNLRNKLDAGALLSSAHGQATALGITLLGLMAEPTAGNFQFGRFHGGLVINRLLTTAEQTSLTTYLAAKQGRTL